MIRTLRCLSAAALLASALGCGVTSKYDICLASCEAARRCGLITDAQAANCRMGCENNRGQLQDEDAAEDRRCTNSADIRRQTLNCLNQECNKIQSCLEQRDTTCIQR